MIPGDAMTSSLSNQIRQDLYNSTSICTTITDLPHEILEQITRRLCDHKKQPFDTIANLDLQNLRLTSRALCLVATPVLFENLVFDEKFLEPQQLSRITDFAAQNPGLARCVRRLQHRVAPILLQDAFSILGRHAAAEICAGAGTMEQLMELRGGERKGMDFDTLLLNPIRRWVWNDLARMQAHPREIAFIGLVPRLDRDEATYAQYHPAFLETVSALPSLSHIEIAHSKHFQHHVDSVISYLNRKYRLNVQFPTIVDKSSSIQAVSIAATQSHEFMHPGITSLRMVVQSVDFYPQLSNRSQALSHLTHLDLECCIWAIDTSMYSWMPDWSVLTAALNEYLSTLFNLRVAVLDLLVPLCHRALLLRRRAQQLRVAASQKLGPGSLADARSGSHECNQ
ncbi:hypothetical protein G7Y79_00018g045600 [Physcia stellaris]|nr:hypothetical protein G7Y79_00018g045600 [Physcia stellaris]